MAVEHDTDFLQPANLHSSAPSNTTKVISFVYVSADRYAGPAAEVGADKGEAKGIGSEYGRRVDAEFR